MTVCLLAKKKRNTETKHWGCLVSRGVAFSIYKEIFKCSACSCFAGHYTGATFMFVMVRPFYNDLFPTVAYFCKFRGAGKYDTPLAKQTPWLSIAAVSHHVALKFVLLDCLCV